MWYIQIVMGHRVIGIVNEKAICLDCDKDSVLVKAGRSFNAFSIPIKLKDILRPSINPNAGPILKEVLEQLANKP